MKTSSRFAVAVHLLTLVALACDEAEGDCLSSERMAESVGTNPVVVRRVLGFLREAGLVESHSGPGGGWRLTRPPETMTLLDVYRALEDEPILATRQAPPHSGCPVGPQLRGVLAPVFRAAEAALERELAEVTVEEVLAAVLAACGPGQRGRLHPAFGPGED
jgi:Rrf2 family protein